MASLGEIQATVNIEASEEAKLFVRKEVRKAMINLLKDDGFLDLMAVAITKRVAAHMQANGALEA